MDSLLDGHEAMLQTPEGQVLATFHEQLAQTAELEQMKRRLHSLLDHPAAGATLRPKQRDELRQLVRRLVDESRRVIGARARGERDVKAFMQSGVAGEQLRVGAVLQEVLDAALALNWQSAAVRRTPGPLPPVAIRASRLPLVGRLRVKTVAADDDDLDLTIRETDPRTISFEIRASLRALDRERLFRQTLAELIRVGRPMTLAELAAANLPVHDLETLAHWLTMARQAGATDDGQTEQVDLANPDPPPNASVLRFIVPKVTLDAARIGRLDPETLE